MNMLKYFILFFLLLIVIFIIFRKLKKSMFRTPRQQCQVGNMQSRLISEQPWNQFKVRNIFVLNLRQHISYIKDIYRIFW